MTLQIDAYFSRTRDTCSGGSDKRESLSTPCLENVLDTESAKKHDGSRIKMVKWDANEISIDQSIESDVVVHTSA